MAVNFNTGIFVLLTCVLTGAVGLTSGRREGCWHHLRVGEHATLAEHMDEGGEGGERSEGVAWCGQSGLQSCVRFVWPTRGLARSIRGRVLDE